MVVCDEVVAYCFGPEVDFYLVAIWWVAWESFSLELWVYYVVVRKVVDGGDKLGSTLNCIFN